MKYPYYLTLALILFCNNLFSQDLIVKHNNDSINCKVVKQSSETVFFFTIVNNEEVMNALKKSEIRSLILNYNSKNKTDSIENSYSRDTTTIIKVFRPPHKHIEIINDFRFSANYGAAYWIFKNPTGLNSIFEDYFNELKTGNAYSFGFNYYSSENYGIGFQYMNFVSNNSISNVTIVSPNGSTQTGNMEDNIQISYLGLSLGSRFSLKNNKWRFNADIGLGFSNYLNNAKFISKSTIKSNNIGTNIQIGLDYSINKYIAVGLVGTLISATTNYYEIDNGTTKNKITLPDNKRENHTRADISIGLRFLIE